MRADPRSRGRKIFDRVTRGLAISLALFLGISFLPGKIEGVYDMAPWGSMGWQVVQFKDGQVNSHLEACGDSDRYCYYRVISPSEAEVWLRSSVRAEPDKLVAHAYPHFWVTRFVFGDSSGSESVWQWKIPLTPWFERDLKTRKVREITVEEEVIRTTYYDYDNQVVETSERPRVKREKAGSN